MADHETSSAFPLSHSTGRQYPRWRPWTSLPWQRRSFDHEARRRAAVCVQTPRLGLLGLAPTLGRKCNAHIIISLGFLYLLHHVLLLNSQYNQINVQVILTVAKLAVCVLEELICSGSVRCSVCNKCRLEPIFPCEWVYLLARFDVISFRWTCACSNLFLSMTV